MRHRCLYSLLAFAGVTPFLACALLPLSGVHSLEPFGRLDSVASSYGLAIVTFLAGAHWATDLYKQSTLPLNLFATSNVVFLVVWFAFVIADVSIALAAQVIAFLFLLFVDYRLLRAGTISRHYFRTRAIATAVASVSLLAILLPGIGTPS